MTTTVKADSPAALLAIVPHLIGYEPRNSLVFITFAGTQSQAVLRIDLPASNNPTVLKRIATQSIGTLCKVRDIDAILPVVYCDEPFGPDTPYRLLADTVMARIRAMGFEVRGALCRASDGWASYLEEPPVGGHPLSELVAPADLPSPEGRFERIPDAPLRVKDGMRGEIEELRELITDDPTSRAFDPLNDITLFLDEALDWDSRQRLRYCGLLLMVLQRPALRDHAMIQWSTSLEFGDENWENGRTLCDRMMGKGPRPDQDRIDAGVDLVNHLLAMSHDELRPAPLCMLAWLHWTQGRSSVAGECVAEALKIDPTYGMAELLARVLSAGMLPEWLFEPPHR